MNFVNDIFSWITGADGGAFLIIAWAFAWAAEKNPSWQKLNSTVKQLIILGLSLILGIGVTALRQNPDLVAILEPYIRTVVYVVSAWLATQAAHEIDPFRKRVNIAEKVLGSANDKMNKE